MGSIRDVSKTNINTHMLITNSSLAEMYIYDTLKATYHAGTDSIFTVDTTSSFNEMLDLVNVVPMMADKWLFIIDYKKTKANLKKRKGIFESTSSVFLVKVKTYKEYKEFKELVDNNVNDIYLSFIRYPDVMFLLQDFEISQKLKDFVAKSYSSDPEQVFVLRDKLRNGAEVKDRKSIIKICGESSSSINFYALSLLKPLSETEKGRSIVLKRRIQTGVELGRTYGISTFRNFLLAAVKDIYDIKQLYLEGMIYDKIFHLPEIFTETLKGEQKLVYDERRLSKYNKYLQTIINIPVNRIMKLYITLQNSDKWYKEIDIINFIYEYYQDRG